MTPEKAIEWVKAGLCPHDCEDGEMLDTSGYHIKIVDCPHCAEREEVIKMLEGLKNGS